MRRTRTSVDSVAFDGGIKLAPGEFLSLHKDRPISPSAAELQQWMAWFRGVVLSTSFGIENEMILLALADEFGANDLTTSDYFNREQTWREDHRLEPKIERVKPIIRRRRSQSEADKIIQGLASYRHLRNLLAHYPCWLEPVNDAESMQTKAFTLCIADRSYVWEVDTEQATEWHRLLIFARVSVENVRREIIGLPLLREDGSLPRPPTAAP
jgi:hypothetical protein